MENKPKILQNSFKIIEIKDLIYIFYIGALYIINITLEVISIASIFPLLTLFFDENLNIFELRNHIIYYSDKLDLSPLLLILFFFSTLLILKNLFNIFYVHTYIKFANDTGAKISSKIFEKRLNSYYLDFIKMGSDIFLRNLKDVSLAYRSYLQNLIFFFSEFLILIVILVYFLITNTFVTIMIIIVSLIFIFFYQLKFKNKIQEWGHNRNIKSGQLNNIILLVYHSIREIKIFSKNKIFVEKYKNETLSFFKFIRFTDFISVVSKNFIEIFIAILILLLIFSSKDKKNLNMNLPALLFNGVVFVRIYPSLNRMLGAYVNLKNNYYSVEIVSKELSLVNFSSNIKNLNEISFKDNITFQNVFFKYPESQSNILENISISINKNDFILVRGNNGSGKSTFINLLCGLIQPSSGRVLLDDKINIFNEFNMTKKLFSIVPQKPFLVNDTILNNITLSLDDQNHIFENRINAIFNRYKIFNFIENFEHKIQTIISENASNISGGQSQVISIARALFKNFEIIIFDEPSTAMDLNNRKLFLELLKDLKDQYTVILITHDKIFENLFFNKIFEINNKKIKIIQ